MNRTKFAMLTVENLSYAYGTHRIFHDVSFELTSGQVACLVGINGAGKTTLLRCLAGWTLPNDGAVSVQGLSLRTHERQVRQHVLLVPDTPDFYDELTAWEHLQLVANLHHIDDWQERSRALLEAFQLTDGRSAFPFTFSRGMRHKLALCMALLIGPPLLLMDEPFGPLDAISGHVLWEALRAHRDSGKSVFFSSHILPAGIRPDSLYLLRDRQINPVDPDSNTDLEALLDHD
jgi:ABC-2 type transport system ATP-binding protein